MGNDFLSAKISAEEAANIAKVLYQIQGLAIPLAGEIDFNYRIKLPHESYLLKISRPGADEDFIDFQIRLMTYLEHGDFKFNFPRIIPDINGNSFSTYSDNANKQRIVRLMSWLPGRLWSSVNPHSADLLRKLGRQAGMLTAALVGFDHPFAHRNFDWDIARAAWTSEYAAGFDEHQKKMLIRFQEAFKAIQPVYQGLRKSMIHNDVNDNNIVVTNDLTHPSVEGIIDYGDAIYTQSINDLAVAIAYGIMGHPDPFGASVPLIAGYHEQFPLQEEELSVLYVLVGMRLVISITKSFINKQKEPGNTYLLISEKAALECLEKWLDFNPDWAHYRFRAACTYPAHPNEPAFRTWAKQQKISLHDLLPDVNFEAVHSPDLTVSGSWLGLESEYNDTGIFGFRLNQLRKVHPLTLIAGGYLEPRPFYCTDAYRKEGNQGAAYRTVHLGLDLWLDASTPVHALFDGIVFSIFNNDHDKDYGPALILQHTTGEGLVFYSLYGYLSRITLDRYQTGQAISKGDLIARVGKDIENGNWASHLHFQLMLDMLGNVHDFPGVAFPEEVNCWKSICPDPGLLFNENYWESNFKTNKPELMSYRQRHLGKSLNLSYDRPLKIVRGSGAFLIDEKGQKYLDTLNNVAHVGHEHPRVVKAGREQMAVLNTNTRYLHERINQFAAALLGTFPEKLSVVHFVNSGSEANELALRMARTFTGQRDMIAVEAGYHGNTQACIDVSSYKFDGIGGKGAPEHTHIVPMPDVYRGIYRGENTGLDYASHIAEQIRNIQSKGRNVAGFICESILSCGGQIELPKDYLKTAYQAVRAAGGLCIADEIQVGCGRVGSHFWAFGLHDVIPDIVTIGKPIGNGHPLAAVVCTQEVAEAFANGMEYFNTFGGNPVSCAIGLEVLRVIEDEHLQQNALNLGRFLKDGLRELQSDFPVVGDVRGQGLFLGMELVDQDKNPLAHQASYLANRMKNLKILMSTDGPDHNVLKIKPPMVFSRSNAEELLLRLRKVLNEDFMNQ